MRRIKNIVIVVAAVTGAVIGLAGPVLAAAFFERLDDVPVMPALQPVDNAGIEFDAPSGRIVEAYAIGAVKRQAVLDFYRGTLPQLGWRVGAGNAFRREGEMLRLDFFGPDGELTVRFTVSPAPPDG